MHLLCYAKQYDARVAAGHCLRLLAERMQHFTPGDILENARLQDENIARADARQEPSPLRDFKLELVLRDGKPLLQSGGQV